MGEVVDDGTLPGEGEGGDCFVASLLAMTGKVSSSIRFIYISLMEPD
jgi:hypothetical protein